MNHPLARTGETVAQLSGHLSRNRDRDLAGRAYQTWVRRGLLGLMGLFVIAALLNAFGQASSTSSATGPAASLEVRAPERLRGGLLFESRFEIQTHRRLANPRLVLGNGWLEGMTLNTTIPDPASERSHDGSLAIDFEPIKAGDEFTVWMQWQVNPVNVGRRQQDVTLYDGTTAVAHVDREVTVFP